MRKQDREKGLEHSPLRLYPDSPELRSLFDSYAVVRYGPDDRARGLWFVPLIPRHMTPYLWRKLFWRDTVLVVVKGHEYKSLCSMCAEAMTCMMAMKNKIMPFACKFGRKTTTVDMRTGDEKRL